MEAASRNVIDKWMFTIFTGLLLLTQGISALDVEVGQEAILRCPLTVEFPEWTGPSNLASPLTNASVINEAGFEWSNNTDLKILNVQTFHTGEYKCSDGSTEGVVQLNVLSYTVSVDILNTVGEPLAETLKVTDGDDLTVMCQVTGGNPAPTVTFRWLENSEGLPDVSNAIVIQELVNNTYIVNASVTFTASQSIDITHLYCTASFGDDKNDTETSATLYVLFPPLVSKHGVNQYPKWNTKTIQMNCDGSSKPGVTFQWMAGDQYLSNTTLTYQETYACIQDPDKAYLQLCKSNITISDVKKEDNGVDLKCVYIFEGAEYLTTDVYTIDLPFPPTAVSVSGNVTAAVGTSDEATITLTCSSDTGNPAPSLKWYKGNKLGEFINTSEYAVNEMPDEFNGMNVTQTIEIKVDRTMDGSQITCCVEANDVCDSVTLDISYPPEILAPQLSEYRAYVGDSVTIPCIVDSKPASVLTWSKLEETDSTLISNNTDNMSNTMLLGLNNIDKNMSGQYECRAWLESLGLQTAVFKTTRLNVFDVPPFPLMMIHFLSNGYPRVTITTDDKSPTIPRKFYIQYRKLSGIWLEISKPFRDTLPGQGETNYQYDFSSFEVQPDTKYEIRVKSEDQLGLAAYSSTQSFTTNGQRVVDDDAVSKTEFRNAILLSVFVTAAVFLIIIIIIVCAIKKGKCHSSSSKSYVM